MPQTLLEMANELVSELIRVHPLSPDDARSLLLSTHATLLRLQQESAPESAITSPSTPGEDAPAAWQRSITKHITASIVGSATWPP